jgi:hypothetical protein
MRAGAPSAGQHDVQARAKRVFDRLVLGQADDGAMGQGSVDRAGFRVAEQLQIRSGVAGSTKSADGFQISLSCQLYSRFLYLQPAAQAV